MKLTLAMIFMSVFSFANVQVSGLKTVDLPTNYKIVTGPAYCKAKCKTNEAGEKKCRYSVRFEKTAWENNIKPQLAEQELFNTWYEKSPKEICENGELPLEGNGTAEARVIFFKVDRSVLTTEF